MARRIELFPFEFYDDIRKRWIRARYRAERHVIAQRYVQARIVGAAEIREEGDLYDGTFCPSGPDRSTR